ncbi:MAG: DUF4011 domain-containing protein [Chloroflexales bacterium]|nr:DUF4011 domain-containing protein [Chloroflexales bacterium]
MPTPRQQIDAWKARLLDLSRRNRMLHTRPGVGGTVALSYPDALRLFDALVRRRRRLTFATPLTLEERLAVLRWDAPATGATVRLDTIAAPLPKDGQLATDLLPADQERALYTLRLRSRTALGEGGVNVLFVALGFLEWFDRDAPELVMRSPLLLVPVELLREKGGDEYALRLLDDELALNPTLAHKLRQDYGIALPALPDDDAIQLDQLFATIGELVARHDGWRVQPECTLGLFSFLKLMLYHDLERAAEIAATHPVLSLLTGEGKTAEGTAGDNILQPSAFSLQPLDERPPEQCYQILDADASQSEAIEAARGGASFVLQGPPGTGKSQTIANIIAECLAQHKRVLFVSEKMAALDVVYERLRQCGLAEFCLEAHSHKASKRAGRL